MNISTSQQLTEVKGEDAPAGSYKITTVNGSVYFVEVPEAGPTLMIRSKDGFPRDPEHGVASLDLHRDGEAVELMGWYAHVGSYGAHFLYFDPAARVEVSEANYSGTRRWTSAVISIEKVA